MTQAVILRRDNPKEYIDYAYRSMRRHVECMLGLQERGAITFDYGNNLRARAQEKGLENAFGFPGFVPAYIRPSSAKGKALSGGQRLAAIPPISPSPTR